MKVLVIGGSLFTGCVFTLQAYQKHQLYLLNRGNYPMTQFVKKEYKMDRHDKNSYKQIQEEFDVVVDFCAYHEGDIQTVMRALEGRIHQYIFISTTNVYKRVGSKEIYKNELFPLEDNMNGYPDDFKDYVEGKKVLEDELKREAEERKIPYTSLRPGMIYGPYNYVPGRENWYFKNIIENHQAIFLKNGTGFHQLVYVKDVARAILALCEPRRISSCYNLCSDELINYESFAGVLRKIVDIPYQEFWLSKEELEEFHISLPFAYNEEETELCIGDKIKAFDFSYTPVEEGLQKTYKIAKDSYRKG